MSRFLIIMQNVNIATKGKVNCRLNPTVDTVECVFVGRRGTVAYLGSRKGGGKAYSSIGLPCLCNKLGTKKIKPRAGACPTQKKASP